jgi:hypothetical protein
MPINRNREKKIQHTATTLSTTKTPPETKPPPPGVRPVHPVAHNRLLIWSSLLQFHTVWNSEYTATLGHSMGRNYIFPLARLEDRLNLMVLCNGLAQASLYFCGGTGLTDIYACTIPCMGAQSARPTASPLEGYNSPATRRGPRGCPLPLLEAIRASIKGRGPSLLHRDEGHQVHAGGCTETPNSSPIHPPTPYLARIVLAGMSLWSSHTACHACKS